MKIAIIDTGSFSLPYDYYYIDALLAQGYRVTFYCSRTAYNDLYLDLLAERDNITLKIFSVSGSRTGRLQGGYNYLRMLVSLLLSAHRYDYIHFFWSVLPAVELPLFALLRRKLVFTFHNDVPHACPSATYFPYKLIYNTARRALFVSPSTMQRFLKHYGVDAAKAHCLNHGLLPLLPDDPVPEPAPLERSIIFWGNVKAYKGVDTLVTMCESGQFDDFGFEVYGKWDSKLAPLKEKLIGCGAKVEDRFLTLTELQQLMRRNAVFILPYRSATQSGVAYTFLYYNRIFISSDQGDNAAILRDAGLEMLVFDAKRLPQIRSAADFCVEHSADIAKKLLLRRNVFEWGNILKRAKELYA
ncbi:glycosyltransferase [Sulfurimonas sp. HSL-3221]|uniref:glycosyltransferase n=1 Tax=Sulfurimonadaceae TaxID=2771471 RepID=UPI001E37E9F7|nr:glycosyltransferase [Sulfurimonas sp. HSL-3221]UFS62403.1 glycosyltransferase [Sulfurimonas sp. HSL-3221]